MLTYSYWVFLVGIIAICVLLMHRIYKKYGPKNRFESWLAWIFLGGFIVFLLFINELFPGSKMYYDYQYSKSITGKSMSIRNVYTYESYRAPLLGDGYSLYLYKIDDESAEYFRNPSESFFSDYPMSNSYNSTWTRKTWTKCPIEPSDSSYWQFALSESSYPAVTAEMVRLDKLKKVVKDILFKKGNYYASSANWQGGHIWDISFYVLSPDDGWLVAIYKNM